MYSEKKHIMYISCIVDYFLFVFLLNLKEGEIYCLKPFLIFLIKEDMN